jgi:ribosomal protein S18 acetylase RimI-like enzyme
MEILIERASAADAETILTLQKLAYQSEATLYKNDLLPPLTESLDDLTRLFQTHTFLVARSGEEIIGSVRAATKEGRCHVGRLMVHPNYQRQGLGARLLVAIEEAFPEASTYELFTGNLSEGNLRLYRSIGYKEFGREPVPPYQLVFLEKPKTKGLTTGGE